MIGTGIGGLGSLEEQHDVLRERGAKAVSPLAVPLMMGNAGRRRGGDAPRAPRAVASAWSRPARPARTRSAPALRMIQAGDADAVVTGGAEAALTAIARAAFAAMGATSPSGISRPFDARRDGFVMGEGAGVLVLEDAEAADARGAESLGELLGYGATRDAYHLTAPQPDGRGAARAISAGDRRRRHRRRRRRLRQRPRHLDAAQRPQPRPRR